MFESTRRLQVRCISSTYDSVFLLARSKIIHIGTCSPYLVCAYHACQYSSAFNVAIPKSLLAFISPTKSSGGIIWWSSQNAFGEDVVRLLFPPPWASWSHRFNSRPSLVWCLSIVSLLSCGCSLHCGTISLVSLCSPKPLRTAVLSLSLSTFSACLDT